MNYRENKLFIKYKLSDVISYKKDTLKKEIAGYDRNYLLNVSVQDLCDYLENKYHIEPIILHKDKICIKKLGEEEVDVSKRLDRVFLLNSDEQFRIKCTSITFSLPFEGNKELLDCQASSFTFPPMGRISDGEILITYVEDNPNSEKIKQDFQSLVSEIEKHIQWGLDDISPYNDSLRKNIEQSIEDRKAKLLKDLNIVSSLGYPINEKLDMPNTYAVPKIKRKLVIQAPAASISPFAPEPALDMKSYESILKIISNMGLVMERSPSAFINMEEEHLRQHFLVQLNGHFEGKAMGEVFNFEGKTDILIRDNGKNIFIAECMFWDGKESLLEKINQILGYTSWRDTKTAIINFNRNKNFTNVLSQIPQVVDQHQNYKRQLEYNSETGFRFIFHNNIDKNRELILTILAFDVPKKIYA